MMFLSYRVEAGLERGQRSAMLNPIDLLVCVGEGWEWSGGDGGEVRLGRDALSVKYYSNSDKFRLLQFISVLMCEVC